MDIRHLPLYSPVTPAIVAAIRRALGDRCVIEDPDRMDEFAKDATALHRLPELVVEPSEMQQVQALLQLANEHRFPVTPRGLGTGLAGGAVPVCGGVVLSMAKMNRILAIDRQNLIAVVEPGVINLDLKTAARKHGLFYPPDPASLDTCSIGGNAATNAGGSSCVKYGTTRDYVLGLEAVLPSGEPIKAGVQTRKGVVGYDLTHLLVGSEGTLAVITKLILKLIAHPPAVSTIVALFPDLAFAMKSVSAILGKGFAPCALEFLDRNCLQLVGNALPFESAGEAGAFLLVQTDGSPLVVDAEAEQMGEICLEHGAIDVILAPDSYKRAQMWEVRRQVSINIEHSCSLYIPEDVVVPIGRIAEFVESLPDFEERFGVKIYSFGHAGDGNIHLNITAQGSDTLTKVEEGIATILQKVISMGGTISGEHGIGCAKKRFLQLELSPVSFGVQREIKKLFDPNLILNPGKIFC
ncbi:MAG: FAD-linked oxidase C-terminal domain-containing protein [Desulforhabdus sp.]|nr:FAD-linked oxidase C-terminal domain-containing protein [Desulforhabdus sp.]